MAKRTKLPAGVSLRDGRYHVRATATDPVSGQRLDRNRLLPEGVDLAQAVAVLEELRAQLVGETAPPTRAPTLADYCESWLARRSKRVRAKTAETYARRLGHLLAHLGEVRVDEIERRHVAWYRDQLAELTVTHATIRSIWRDSRIVLRDALAEYGRQDVTARIEPPCVERTHVRSRDTLSRQEVDALLAATTGRYAALVRFLARTGCRLGEGRGLRWCDLDLDARVAHLRQSIVELGGPGSGRWQTTAPKSGRARTVGLTDDLVESLRAHRQAHPGVGEALVWQTDPKPNGRTRLEPGPAHYQAVVAAMQRAATRAKIETHVSPQVLRRTFNTLALASGVDRVLLQGMIGHSGDAMSAHYHGLRAETAARVAEEVWR